LGGDGNDRCGSITSDQLAPPIRGMSASPPIATELMLCREPTRCAKGLNRSRGRAPRARQHDSRTGRPVLKMRSLQPHSRQEHPHDRRGDEPVAPAHDRRHDDPEVRAEDPAGLHPNHQEAGCVSRSVAGHGDVCTAAINRHVSALRFFFRITLKRYATGALTRGADSRDPAWIPNTGKSESTEALG
jgi:hypothetical protein